MKKRIKQFTAIGLVSLLTFAMAGCGGKEKEVAVAEELSANYSRQATQTGEITDEFKQGMSQFSVKLLQQTLTKDQKNDLVSPLSAAQCLGLIANGANGNTLSQLEDLFGLPIDELNRAAYAYTSSLYTDDDCKVTLANSVWFKNNALSVRPAFLQTNADWYGAQAYSAPFDDTTLQDINQWCSNHTQGKIDKILDKISPDAVMYLLNALDFDAKWNVQYKTIDVIDWDFYNYDGTTSLVKILDSEENTYLTDEQAVGFARPYKGEAYSFVGILPNEGVDIYEYVESLNGERWRAMWEERVTHTVYAKMPEFTYDTDMMLNEALQTLGVTDMFDPYLADFSNTNGNKDLYCAFVKQKTFIQVDRNGTKAAAVTIGGDIATSGPPVDDIRITLDRPFVYAIVDNANGLPLFLGVVTNL